MYIRTLTDAHHTIKHRINMKTFLAAVVVLAVFATAQAALDRQKSIDLLNKCKKETGATEDAEKTFDDQTIPSTPEGKCMMACVLREKGLMKGDKVDAQAVSAFFEKTYSDDPEKLEKAAEAVGKCATLDLKGKDKCEIAVAYLECGQRSGFSL